MILFLNSKENYCIIKLKMSLLKSTCLSSYIDFLNLYIICPFSLTGIPSN